MASERGGGQTGSRNIPGVRTAIRYWMSIVELCGKASQRGWEPCRRNANSASWIQSTAGHVKPGGNMGGPPSKPKYYPVTDRVIVLWRKGEKDPGRGVKQNLKPCAYKHREHVKVWSGTYCRMVRRVCVTGKVKCLRHGAAAKASLKRAYEVGCTRPETEWPTHVQDEVEVKLHGGPNARLLK